MDRPPNLNVRVLSVGYDNLLLRTRALVLVHAGYAVCSVPPSDTSAFETEFDVVVLCRSIAKETARNLARTVKARYPSTKIVRLSPSASIYEGAFDAVCDPSWGPMEFLAVFARLTYGARNLEGREAPRTSEKSLAHDEGGSFLR